MKEYYDEDEKCTGYIAETYEELVQLFDDLDGLSGDEIYSIRCDINLSVRYMSTIVDIRSTQ